MDKIIGKGRITANSVIVYSSSLPKLFGKKKIKLSFTDSGAFPFARFLTMGLNQEVLNIFLIGQQGTTHGSLFQIANTKNQKTLGTYWYRDTKYQSLAKILSSGRIWTKEKIIVMRDNRPNPNIVDYAVSQLRQQGISDIDSYKLLYMDNNNCIHECQIDDYIRGCANNFGYQTTEELPPLNVNSKTSNELNGMSQAEYNFYKRYGLGDSVEPKHNVITEISNNKRKKLLLTETEFNETLIECISKVLKRFI